jgi:imidazolonepropionase
MWDRLFQNVNIATMDPAVPGAYGAILDGAVAIEGGRIAWVGPRADLPQSPEKLSRETDDLGGGWLTPGLVDCHTHLVFSGDRSGEFEARLNGASYEEIAKAGGGILSTVNAVRAASTDDLVTASRPRLQALIAGGVTTVEIKSGYGLDTKSERAMLEAATALSKNHAIRVQRSFLGLHALPPEFKGRRGDYISLVCEEMLPTLASEGLVDAVDGFCEGIGFSRHEIERVFKTARDLVLPVKLHAEQLSDLKGAALAAQYQALSADHLEYISEDAVAAMAQAGTVAVLLPGAFYALRETKTPPVALFRKHAVPMAIGTDLNPGSSPLLSPTLTMNMACTFFRMTPEEALAGMTREGARAIGLLEKTGTITSGKAADLCHWNITRPAELSYWIGLRGPARRIVGGKDTILQ